MADRLLPQATSGDAPPAFRTTVLADAGQIDRDRIATSFARAAAGYDMHAALQREVADTLLDTLPHMPGHRYILDLGCGTGYCTGHLLNRFVDSEIVALDIALPMLERTGAHYEHKQLDCVCADAAMLPFAAASFDLVVASLSLQWCGDPGTVFTELARVLKPHGVAVLSTFGPDSLKELRNAWSVVDTYTHVNRFDDEATLQQAATRASMHLEINSRLMTRWYRDLRSISRELKGIGAHNMNTRQAPGLTGRQAFRQAEQRFARDFQAGSGIPVTYEIFYLTLVHKP